ncbi:hypothetical protein GOBAR_DD08956 [Gossypium barbadense]|nr:hypothetical protein GOBAR_DD08956 [Gossypium barbadense]
MLGGGGTTASVSSGGGCNGINEAAAPVAVFDTNDGNSNNSGEDDRSKVDEGDRSFGGNRWPRQETLALLKINSPKGPLWEEISNEMKKLGYNRNAKRCKEKWENINKYFKKVKESNKRRPVDSKTCPYFHLLDVLYREKNKHDCSSKSNPLMVRPEKQWPPPLEPHQQHHDTIMEDMMESDQNDDEEEDEGGSYELVASKPVSMGTAE